MSLVHRKLDTLTEELRSAVLRRSLSNLRTATRTIQEAKICLRAVHILRIPRQDHRILFNAFDRYERTTMTLEAFGKLRVPL